MVTTTTPKRLLASIALSFLILGNILGYAQTIIIGTPSLSFTQACASQSFNSYNVSFTVFPTANIQSGNQFIVEMSDSSGSFATATTLTTVTSSTTTVNANFSLPTTTAGENYRIRVRSTAPAVTSPSSVAFSAYYAVHNQPFSINNNVGTLSFCEGGNATLQVDATGTPASPLFYSGLNYKWYRNFAEISGATGPSLNITQSGNYYAIVDYGSCVMNSYSNIVTVNVTPGINLSISAANGEEVICNGNPRILTSSHQNSGYTYQWFKNNVAISGATNATYAATQEGTYKLKITFGGCEFESNSIFLELVDLLVDWDVDPLEILIPGETLTIASITNAVNPTYQWKKNNITISGANLPTYTLNQPGIYTLVVTENTTCNVSEELNVTVQFPTGFNGTIQNNGDYLACSSSSSTLTLASLTALTTNGNISVNTSNSSYTYQWLLNNNPIAGATSTSYTIANATQNGNYKLRITIPGYTPFETNSIAVNLRIETPTVTVQGALCGVSTVTLQSSITHSEYSYRWYRNNVLITGATQPSYTTNQIGNYYVVLSHTGCTATSAAVNLVENSIAAELNYSGSTLLIPGETKTLSVTTNANNPQFQWFRNNAIIAGATSSTYNATEDGTYRVLVTQSVGCNATQEASVVLHYPNSFTVTIGPNSGYENCSSTQATLSITSFQANGNTETQSLLSNSFGYVYDWYRNGTMIQSSSSTTFNVSSNALNGTYELRIQIPNFPNVISNNVTIQLGVAESIVLTSSGTLCENGGEVVLSSSVTNSQYELAWYAEGSNQILGTSPELTVSIPGNYYLTAVFQGCNYTSNSLDINVTTSNGISLSIPQNITLIQGGSRNVTASGAESYVWILDNTIVGTGTDFLVTQPGNYTVTGTTGSCEYSTTFTVTVVENTSTVVPNVVTMNNDGKNDFWSIPNEYVNKEEVEVTIYSSTGKVVYRTRNYQNNWPEPGLQVSKKEPVYYYTISENEAIVKKGSITVIQ